MIRRILLAVCFAFSACAFADGDWWARSPHYTSSGGYYSLKWTSFAFAGDYRNAQIHFLTYMPLRFENGLWDYHVAKSAAISNAVSHVVIADSVLVNAPSVDTSCSLALSVYSLVVRMAQYSGVDPLSCSHSVTTNGANRQYNLFRPLPYIALVWSDPSARSAMLGYLGSIDTTTQSLLLELVGANNTLTNVLSLVQSLDMGNSAVVDALYPGSFSLVEQIRDSVAPSVSNLSERIYQSGITGGATPLWWLHSLGYDNQFTFDPYGFVISATPMGMDLLQQKYAASASYDADRQQLVNSLIGYRVSGDTYTHDGASNFTLDGRTFSMTDLQAATLPQLWSYQARVNMAVDTNDVRRLGRSLVDPDSASNVRKRALDQQATQDAIAGALNGRVVPVSVQNWPVDGIKVKFDDPTIELTSSQFGAVESIDTNLQQLRAAFKDWSGVDDGGRWLPVQDAVLTNIYAIAQSLLSLTNRNNDVSNILYSVATSNQLNDIQAEADAFLSQAESDYREISGLFDAERYIEFRHTNLNFLASSQFAPLRQLADNGSQLPDYVNLQVGSFGAYQFPTVTVQVSHIAPLCNASRWFFRCVWIVLVCLFYWFLGVYAFRFYKWVTGKFAGMGYYMS